MRISFAVGMADMIDGDQRLIGTFAWARSWISLSIETELALSVGVKPPPQQPVEQHDKD